MRPSGRLGIQVLSVRNGVYGSARRTDLSVLTEATALSEWAPGIGMSEGQ
jgi:hypothetical protein